jgi:long-chain acyl-CoA synthetase
LLAENRRVFVETYFACQRAGFRLTPVNWHLSADEAAYIVDDCDAKAFVATADFAGVATPCLAQAGGCTVATTRPRGAGSGAGSCRGPRS